MREILFRGKRTDNDEGEFVYGIPVEGEPLLGMGKRTYIITDPGVQWLDGVYMTYDECIEVDPGTVGQYTGLTDKNGKKIFEGDIVKLTDDYNDFEWKAVVVFGNPNNSCCWGYSLCPIGKCESTSDILMWVDMEESGAYCEIIGNIHDKKLEDFENGC